MYGLGGFKKGVKPGDLAIKTPVQAGKRVPREWVEPTGHRVIRLTDDSGGTSFYFHQNPYTENGDRLVVSAKGGFAAIDLTTLGKEPCKITYLATGGGRTPILGKKTAVVSYVKSTTSYPTH